MARSLPFGLLTLMALSIPSIATANPITYDFTGVLTSFNPSPENGYNGPRYSPSLPLDVIGSFTINANPTLSGPNLITESGNDVSLTVYVGPASQYVDGDGTHFSGNRGGFFGTWATMSASLTNGSDSVYINGGLPYRTPGIEPVGFGVGFYNLLDPLFSNLNSNNRANLQNFNFSATNVGTMSGNGSISYVDDLSDLYDGYLTSIKEVPAPEPGTLLIFATLGAGAVFHQRRRRSSPI